MEGSLIFNTIKEYPNMIKISIYHEPIRVFNGYKRKRRKNPESSDSSIRRTRTALEDLCIILNYFVPLLLIQSDTILKVSSFVGAI